MQLTLTTSPVATRDGVHIIIPIQADVELRLTPHEAMRLGRVASREAALAVDAARFTDPSNCEVITLMRAA